MSRTATAEIWNELRAAEAEIERLRAGKDDILKTCAWLLDRNAIIEECARVAYECTTGIEACRKIRALKDKP